MSNNKKTGFAGKGYYIALILCALAIGITGYWYYRDSAEQDASLRETEAELVVGTAGTEDIPVIATAPAATSGTGAAAPATSAPTTAPTAAAKQPLKTMSPTAGSQITGYSMEALSYNQTTRDWRVHNGVDLAAESGAEVYAPADGQVTAAYEDEALGWMVVIRHSGGYVTTCASLAEAPAVEQGDKVTLGQVIGTAGATAITESALGSHVHFAVTLDGNPIDPAEFLALGE